MAIEAAADNVVLSGGNRDGWAYNKASAEALANAEAQSWRGWPWVPTGRIEWFKFFPKTGDAVSYEAEVWTYDASLDHMK